MAYSYKQVTNDFMKILSVQYICDYFFQDNYCPDSIMMWSAHTIIQTCMHMLMRALFLCQGQRTYSHKHMSIQDYMSSSKTYLNSQIQTVICP